jgi:hypothetical protein
MNYELKLKSYFKLSVNQDYQIIFFMMGPSMEVLGGWPTTHIRQSGNHRDNEVMNTSSSGK